MVNGFFTELVSIKNIFHDLLFQIGWASSINNIINKNSEKNENKEVANSSRVFAKIIEELRSKE